MLGTTSQENCANTDSQGYIEEWQQPPVMTPEQRAAGGRSHEEKWLRWFLWWPSQMLLRQCKCSQVCDWTFKA